MDDKQQAYIYNMLCALLGLRVFSFRQSPEKSRAMTVFICSRDVTRWSMTSLWRGYCVILYVVGLQSRSPDIDIRPTARRTNDYNNALIGCVSTRDVMTPACDVTQVLLCVIAVTQAQRGQSLTGRQRCRLLNAVWVSSAARRPICL